jgi:acyl-CoA synthetase (NDP forming)
LFLNTRNAQMSGAVAEQARSIFARNSIPNSGIPEELPKFNSERARYLI